VGGFDRHLPMEDLESFLLKYGKIKAFIRQQDRVSFDLIVFVHIFYRKGEIKALYLWNMKTRRAQKEL
jgi:hypothetical protein